MTFVGTAAVVCETETENETNTGTKIRTKNNANTDSNTDIDNNEIRSSEDFKTETETENKNKTYKPTENNSETVQSTESISKTDKSTENNTDTEKFTENYTETDIVETENYTDDDMDAENYTDTDTDMEDEIDSECSGRVCVRFCCPDRFHLDTVTGKCAPAEYDSEIVSENLEIPGNARLVFGLPSCAPLHIYDSRKEEFEIFNNSGNLQIQVKRILISTHSVFCQLAQDAKMSCYLNSSFFAM
jgi:hypothetical protein